MFQISLEKDFRGKRISGSKETTEEGQWTLTYPNRRGGANKTKASRQASRSCCLICSHLSVTPENQFHLGSPRSFYRFFCGRLKSSRVRPVPSRRPPRPRRVFPVSRGLTETDRLPYRVSSRDSGRHEWSGARLSHQFSRSLDRRQKIARNVVVKTRRGNPINTRRVWSEYERTVFRREMLSFFSFFFFYDAGYSMDTQTCIQVLTKILF